MITIETIRSFYPASIRENSLFDKAIVKEYLQLMILNYLSSTPYVRKLVFIGGTNLRLVKGIDRFSEDIDFDCKRLTRDEFVTMTDGVIQFLQRSGLDAEARDRVNTKLKAFRRSIYFPQMLFEMGLTGHREERLLVKVETEDQKINYQPVIVNIKGCGFFFPFPVPPDQILCSMKIAALLDRQKGRDFYDVIFLMSQTTPDYNFLSQRFGISNLTELKLRIMNLLDGVNLSLKRKEFEHLLINTESSAVIVRFAEFIQSL
jgi:predicted nucleotidyltransferase component of viral defense system